MSFSELEMSCVPNTTTAPKGNCNEPTNEGPHHSIIDSMHQWIDRWVALWIGAMTVCRCADMDANPPPTLQGSPTMRAQW